MAHHFYTEYHGSWTMNHWLSVVPLNKQMTLRSLGDRSVETNLKEGQTDRQIDRQTADTPVSDKLNLRLPNLTMGPDSGTEVWPSAWRHGTLLPISRDSLPFLLSPALFLFSHLGHCCLVQHVLPVLLYICLIYGSSVDQSRLHPQAFWPRTKLTRHWPPPPPPPPPPAVGLDISPSTVSHVSHSLWSLLL